MPMNLSIVVAITIALGSVVAARAESAAPTETKGAEAKIPDGVEPELTSTDPAFGYTKEKPIKVGSKDELGGPAAERSYLRSLRDEAGKPVTFERLGSVGGLGGNILDTSKGRTLFLYIDMYHPGQALKQPASKGGFSKPGFPRLSRQNLRSNLLAGACD
jgi:hypothetical protein